MFFNAKKCHVMRLGKKNLHMLPMEILLSKAMPIRPIRHSLYHLNGTLITPVNQENDLGVTVCDTLSGLKKVLESVKKPTKCWG